MADEQPITKLNVSTSKDEEDMCRAQGYQLINTNKGAGNNSIYLWYKKEAGMKPVTRIQFSFNDNMKTGLVDAGYELVDRDFNKGVGGDYIFLWYFCGSTEYDIPIVNLELTKDAKEEVALLKDGWERLGCDLNRRARGKFIYLWVKRAQPSYISDITVNVDFCTDKQLFKQGYTRVDEDTNRDARGNYIFLWYCRSTYMSRALTALDVSTNPRDESNLHAKRFRKVEVDLNKGAGGKYVYVWQLKEECRSQVKAVFLLINPEAWEEYENTGVIIVDKNLNEGNKGMEMYLAYN